MKKFSLLLFGSIIVIVLSQCKKDEEPAVETPVTHSVNVMSDMIVAKDFNFETSKKVTISINDFKNKAGNDVKYEIYIHDEDNTTETVTYLDEEGNTQTVTVQKPDPIKNKIQTIITSDANFNITATVPIYCNSLYVVRNEMGSYSSAIISVNGTKALYNRAGNVTKSTNQTYDVLYAVNGGGDLLTINHETGEMAKISDLPDGTGSYTCAIDPVSRKLYTMGHNAYLYCWDIDAETWTTVGYSGVTGPRMGYNQNDGLIYFSSYNRVYTINPSTASVISTYYIEGLQTTSGGDLTFDSDGTMYLSTTTGLYRCAFGDGNTITTTWISSESLPNYPNSLTFDSNGELFWATVAWTVDAYKGRVFIMDKVTGGWEDKYTPYTYYIHDLALLPYDEASVPVDDSDGDGIIDFYDEYPNDPEKASATYTPSIYGWGTYAFEDLWPYKGDYDFNDLVLNYRYTNIANADGNIVETKLNFVIKNIGGSYKNGFGIELNMDESLIESFTGYSLTENIVSLNSKGLEQNQTNPVIIIFDNAWGVDGSEMELTLKYTNPITPNQLGDFNPFIFIDGDRGREVHLSNKPPTDLMNTSLLGSEEDNTNTSNGIYYKTSNGLPWGIDIIHDFVYPKEKQEIIKGYPFFATWAESGGTSVTDWYKEKSGYRDYNYLKQN